MPDIIDARLAGDPSGYTCSPCRTSRRSSPPHAIPSDAIQSQTMRCVPLTRGKARGPPSSKGLTGPPRMSRPRKYQRLALIGPQKPDQSHAQKYLLCH
jgi:hypothetical protein